jgi:hypothetical protein
MIRPKSTLRFIHEIWERKPSFPRGVSPCGRAPSIIASAFLEDNLVYVGNDWAGWGPARRLRAGRSVDHMSRQDPRLNGAPMEWRLASRAGCRRSAVSLVRTRLERQIKKSRAGPSQAS